MHNSLGPSTAALHVKINLYLVGYRSSFTLEFRVTFNCGIQDTEGMNLFKKKLFYYEKIGFNSST